METILIDENRLKIVLDKADTQKYAADIEDVSSGIEKSIREILTVASDSVDFPFENGCFFAELYMSSDGGCEIYITRTEEKSMFFTSGEKELLPKIYKNLSEPCGIYMFTDTENVLSLCKELTHSEDCDTSRVYYDTQRDVFYVSTCKGACQAAEFGGVKCPDTEKFYICEHCNPVGDGSPSTLAKLAL